MNARKAVELGFADVVLYEGKEEQPAEDPPTEEAEIEAQMYSSRVMDMAILNRLGVTGKAEEPPSAPVIGMDGKTEDGAMPYQILIDQLEFLR